MTKIIYYFEKQDMGLIFFLVVFLSLKVKVLFMVCSNKSPQRFPALSEKCISVFRFARKLLDGDLQCSSWLGSSKVDIVDLA